MNFMAKISSQGFYEEDQNQSQMNNSTTSRVKLPFSSSSSSSPTSSTQQHKSLVPPTFHHYHHHHYLQQKRGSWLENKFEAPQPSPEEITSHRCYIGGGAANNNNNNASENDATVAGASDDNDITRGGDSSSDVLLGLGGGGGAAGTSTVGVVVERVHMFDKVVTPSDVGKLNRLVIPKQHAEKYFPLDSSTNEKGLLLNFEDRNGKPWRFRYSYWNSSQSYVMTKGWSRFVKEKKLDAGDIVSFQRGAGELGKDRLFIDWRRRPDAPELAPCFPTLSHLPHEQYFSSFHNRSTTPTHPWSPLFLQQQSPQAAIPQEDQPNIINYQQPYSNSYGGYSYGSGGPYGYGYSYGYNSTSVVNPCSSSVIYLRSEAAAAGAPQQAGMVQVQSGGSGNNSGVEEPMVFESVPVVHGKAAAKRLRLFGVNMDCPIPESDECDMLSTIAPHPPHLSSSPIPPLQLRLYNGSPLPAAMQSDLLDKARRTSNI